VHNAETNVQMFGLTSCRHPPIKKSDWDCIVLLN